MVYTNFYSLAEHFKDSNIYLQTSKKTWQAVTKAQNGQECTNRQKGEGRRVNKLRLLEWALWDRKKKLHTKTERTMMTMRQKGQGYTDTEKTRMYWGRNDCTSIFYVNLVLWYILGQNGRGYTRVHYQKGYLCVCVSVLKCTAYVIHCGGMKEGIQHIKKFSPKTDIHSNYAIKECNHFHLLPLGSHQRRCD